MKHLRLYGVLVGPNFNYRSIILFLKQGDGAMANKS